MGERPSASRRTAERPSRWSSKTRPPSRPWREDSLGPARGERVCKISIWERITFMGLKEYKRKRNFKVTFEPEGKERPTKREKALEFVVQKHRATQLHYDLRLEWNGVMLSW